MRRTELAPGEPSGGVACNEGGKMCFGVGDNNTSGIAPGMAAEACSAMLTATGA